MNCVAQVISGTPGGIQGKMLCRFAVVVRFSTALNCASIRLLEATRAAALLSKPSTASAGNMLVAGAGEPSRSLMVLMSSRTFRSRTRERSTEGGLPVQAPGGRVVPGGGTAPADPVGGGRGSGVTGPDGGGIGVVAPCAGSPMIPLHAGSNAQETRNPPERRIAICR